MFGSILAMSNTDVILSVILSIVVILVFVLLYNRLFLITIDENYAKSLGINVTYYQFIISILTAITVVIGMKIVGTLLISSLIVFPATIGRNITKSFKGLVIVSAVVSVVCFLVGMIVSFILNLPTGASIVAVNIIFLIVISLLSNIKVKKSI